MDLSGPTKYQCDIVIYPAPHLVFGQIYLPALEARHPISKLSHEGVLQQAQPVSSELIICHHCRDSVDSPELPLNGLSSLQTAACGPFNKRLSSWLFLRI